MKTAFLLFVLVLSRPLTAFGQVPAPAANGPKVRAAKQKTPKGGAAAPSNGNGAAAPDQAAQAAAVKLVKTVTDGAKQGAPLATVSNVSESLNIESVMLPKSVVQRVFGREVAKNYAVIEVNIANRSNEAGFVLQSLFIDFSNWALGNALGINVDYHHPKEYQARGSAQQVSSVEYRIVRGEMLDAQPWTPRNQLVRSARVLGAIGTAFAFPFSRDVVSGINAWNGGVVPGLDALFPDGTDAQINRVSDYGFRDNKIVPQQSSDIVIAFFPVDRFLSPGLKSIFLDSPSLFFNPILLALDPKTSRKVEPVLEKALDTTDKETVKKALAGLLHGVASLDPDESARLSAEEEDKDDAVKQARSVRDAAQAERDTKNLEVAKDTKAKKTPDIAGQSRAETRYNEAQANYITAGQQLETARAEQAKFLEPLKQIPLYNLLKNISLSNVHIKVSGIMTVDETIIPASIEDSCFDHDEMDALTLVGTRSCYLKGRFLSGGTPAISVTSGADPGISSITVNKDASTADNLVFSFQQKEPPNGTTLQIVVTKTGKNGQAVDSMKYLVTTGPLAGLTIGPVSQDATKVTVPGTGFFQSTKAPLMVALRPVANTDSKGDLPINDATITSEKITLSMTSVNKNPMGCYFVSVTTAAGPMVSVGKVAANGATCN